jgi:hypothetical protein
MMILVFMFLRRADSSGWRNWVSRKNVWSFEVAAFERSPFGFVLNLLLLFLGDR